MGNIIGQDSGGIVGAEVGYNDIPEFIPNILIQNCYTLGTVSNTSGSICGGDGGITYANTPIVNIVNCYSLFGPIVSPNYFYNPIQTNCGVGNGIWSDSTASLYLELGPTYSSEGELINPVGSVWIDYVSDNYDIPWLFSTFGYSPYTIILTDTYSQSIQVGSSSNPAIEQTGHVYSLASINNKPPSKFPQISINSSTGSITALPSHNMPNTFNIKVLQQSNYTMTNFILTVKKRCTEQKYSIKLKTCVNKKIKINLSDYIPDLFFVKTYILIKKKLHGQVCISKCGELTYKPNLHYVGNDNFVLDCVSSKDNYNKLIYFEVKIKD